MDDVSVVVSNPSSLSLTVQEFINSTASSIVDDVATLSGPVVCRNSSVRDELAAAMASLVGTEENGTFVDGAAQCGICGKVIVCLTNDPLPHVDFNFRVICISRNNSLAKFAN